MPEVFKRKIISLLKHPDYVPLKISQLAKQLGVEREDNPAFQTAAEHLLQEGQIVTGVNNLISLPPLTGHLTGTFRLNPKGFGFVIPLDPNAHGDLFIPPGASANAMTGDTVEAVVVRQTRRGAQLRSTGKILEILERGRNRFTGTLLRKGQAWFIQPDGKAFVEPVYVEDISAKEANEKDKVVFELYSYPTEDTPARGVIVEVLGKAGQYASELQSIIHQHHLPGDFDEGCLEQARQAGKGFNPEYADGREDLTGKIIITIDPPDAKDFDDAISIEKDAKGNLILGVHIADVSSFIAAGSHLDAEARSRGNSIYLPNKTIPMLPEILSNGICSLQPEQKRFCKSVYLTYDEGGKILARRFANSVIKSTQRLTYHQADNALKGHTKGIKPEVTELLKDMENLARIIERRRDENGMIHLELPEIELIMDKSGRVIDAQQADTSYPHTMIEMFMVEANDAVASLLDGLKKDFMRRIHPEPDTLTMKNLSELVRGFGLSLPKTPDKGDIQRLLAAVKGKEFSFPVNMLVLRSFEKAQYSPLRIGHYALASTHYCHFTSPIRRYADLMVHRLLDSYLQKYAAGGELSYEDLVETGRHITFTEERADDAEEELKEVLLLQMLSGHVGEELDCVVTGLTAFGVFVQSRKFGIEGLIQMADLGQDDWQYNQRTRSIAGRRSGCEIRLGRKMKVKITGVNVAGRQLGVIPAEPLVVRKGRKTRENIAGKKVKPHDRKRRARKRR